LHRISSCPCFWIISIYREIFVLKSCVQSHLPLCSQFFILSEQYTLYMKGWINTGVNQTELLFECLHLFRSHFHAMWHKKVITNSWRILWIFQDIPKNHEDVTKQFCYSCPFHAFFKIIVLNLLHQQNAHFKIYIYILNMYLWHILLHVCHLQGAQNARFKTIYQWEAIIYSHTFCSSSVVDVTYV